MDLLPALTLLALAVFLGVELIIKVPPTLHTPLMSGSNAISGITLIGAVTAAGSGSQQPLTALLGSAAVALAMVNVVGGFSVTHRMLHMFSPKRGSVRGAASGGTPETGEHEDSRGEGS